ncbi:MAG: hypothetical protein LBW77_01690, partial [Verrucomicrobiota bacterium]|nr:hypothetical protein [Verrucomicrobiota bacterium]
MGEKGESLGTGVLPRMERRRNSNLVHLVQNISIRVSSVANHSWFPDGSRLHRFRRRPVEGAFGDGRVEFKRLMFV